MVKQKQVKNSPKSAQKSAKNPKSMRWQDYVSLLPPDELIGKVVDPKMIQKIIAKNRARKTVDKQKILADTMMDISKSLKRINYEDYVSIFPPEELYGKVVDPKIIEKIIAKNRARKAIDNQKILVNTMMGVAKEDKIKVTKEIKEAFAEIAKAVALKTAERAYPYPTLNKNGVVLNWMTSTAGCRPSCSYVKELLEKSIRKAKSQAKPNLAKQNNEAKPVVESKTSLQKKHKYINKKASMQPDSIKKDKAKNAKPMPTNKELKKKTTKSTATCISRNKPNKPTYAEMIKTAIMELKEKRGSSRQAIMKHMATTSKVAPKAFLVNKTIKKMIEKGSIVPGAKAGQSGSGCFKLVWSRCSH